MRNEHDFILLFSKIVCFGFKFKFFDIHYNVTQYWYYIFNILIVKLNTSTQHNTFQTSNDIYFYRHRCDIFIIYF